jgi:xylitol oxidase
LSEVYNYNKEPMVAFSFDFTNNATAYAPLYRLIDQQLKPFGARPHWGNNFTMPPSRTFPQAEHLSETRGF